MTIQTEKFQRKTFIVDGVQVTDENMAEIAEWCKGHIQRTKKDDVPYIKVSVKHPMTAKQTMAFAGDWVLFSNNGFKVFTDGTFKKAFEAVFKDDGQPV